MVSKQKSRFNEMKHLPHVGICNDWSQVVNVGKFCSCLHSCGYPFVVVLLVMKLLGTEYPLNLVRDGSIGVVAEIVSDKLGTRMSHLHHYSPNIGADLITASGQQT